MFHYQGSRPPANGFGTRVVRHANLACQSPLSSYASCGPRKEAADERFRNRPNAWFGLPTKFWKRPPTSTSLHSSAFAGAASRSRSGLQRKFNSSKSGQIPVGILDINLYRDDLSTVGDKPILNATEISFPVTGKISC